MMTSKLIQINICNILCLPSFKTSIKKQTSNTLQKQTQKQSYTNIKLWYYSQY